MSETERHRQTVRLSRLLDRILGLPLTKEEIKIIHKMVSKFIWKLEKLAKMAD